MFEDNKKVLTRLYDNFYPHVALWNIKRDMFSFANEDEHHFEDENWIQEEFKEFFEAIKNRDIPHAFQELCDVIFVYFGYVAKVRHLCGGDTVEYNWKGAIETALGVLDREIRLKYIEAGLQDVCKEYVEMNAFSNLMMASFVEVCQANDLKPTTKINGKVVKGDNYASPLGAIQELVNPIFG